MMQFSQPPPPIPSMTSPQAPQAGGGGFNPRFGGMDKPRFYQPYRPYPRPGVDASEFDGKRLRKSVMRKTVDYNSAVIRMIENRVWQRDWRDRRALQPDVCYCPEFLPPSAYPENASNAITTRFVKTATNKMRCPVFCLAWTPEGRRLVTGASSGEFTLWNGLTFNFETILQAHDSPVRTMVWSHNDVWMVTGDHGGYVKYWQSNMNNVKMFQAHKEALRGISFSPSDQKFATCSDDGTIRIWDFLRCQEERILRGHGADVKCIHWHPQKGLIISGSKDNQQPVKLWDPKTGQSLATLHAHKSTVMDVRWNENGNWLVTASRDHLLKLFDLRNLSTEVQTFRGHKKEASAVAWHPTHEGLFCSGGSDGAILFWHVGADKEIGAIEQAHDSIVWSLAWHPMGHILCSGSNDHTSKFWTRNRPGDQMRDKYNLNTLPAGASGYDDNEIDDQALIPGMGPEDKVELGGFAGIGQADPSVIPGLDFDSLQDSQKPIKKVPYAKPIPKNFQAQWNETKGRMEDGEEGEEGGGGRRRGLTEEQLTKAIAHFIETNPPPGVLPLADVEPAAIILMGKVVTVEPGSALAQAIAEGTEAIMALVEAGEVPELQEVLRRQREGGNDSDDENLELRPEEHESYDGGDEEQRYYDEFDETYGEPWTEQDEMNQGNYEMGGNFDPNMGPPSNFDSGPGNFGPNMGCPGNFGPGGPNMGWQGGNFGPGDQNMGGPGNFGPNMGRPGNFNRGGPNMGWQGGNFGPGGPGPNMGGPGPNMGGPGPNMGGPGPNMGGPGPNMGGPGPNMGGPGPNMGGPGPNMGGPGPNMGGPGPNMGGPGPNMGGPGPNMGPGNFGGPPGNFGPNSGGNFQGPGSNFGGPGPGPGPGNFMGNDPRVGPAMRSNYPRGGRGGRGNNDGGNFRGNDGASFHGNNNNNRGGTGDGNWGRPPWEQGGPDWNGPDQGGNQGGNWNRGGGDSNWRGGSRGGGGGGGGDNNWRGGRGGGDNCGNWGGDNRGARGGGGFNNRRGSGRTGSGNWGNRGGGNNQF